MAAQLRVQSPLRGLGHCKLAPYQCQSSTTSTVVKKRRWYVLYQVPGFTFFLPLVGSVQHMQHCTRVFQIKPSQLHKIRKDMSLLRQPSNSSVALTLKLNAHWICITVMNTSLLNVARWHKNSSLDSNDNLTNHWLLQVISEHHGAFRRTSWLLWNTVITTIPLYA